MQDALISGFATPPNHWCKQLIVKHFTWHHVIGQKMGTYQSSISPFCPSQALKLPLLAPVMVTTNPCLLYLLFLCPYSFSSFDHTSLSHSFCLNKVRFRFLSLFLCARARVLTMAAISGRSGLSIFSRPCKFRSL